MAIVGYYVHAQDSGSVMYSKESPLPRCSRCGFRLDFFAHNPDYVLGRAKYDVYATLDGQTIVSSRLRDFCKHRRHRGLRFLGFEGDPHHFHLVVERVVPVDSERGGTRCGSLCNVCGNHQYVVGAIPPFLKIKDPLDDGMFRSDLLFGDGDKKHPLRFVGPKTKALMQAADLKIVFSPVEGLQ